MEGSKMSGYQMILLIPLILSLVALVLALSAWWIGRES